jgi:hypothetical protein
VGLVESAAEFFPKPSTKVLDRGDDQGAPRAAEDNVAAREKAIRLTKKLRAVRLTRAVGLVKAAVEETLTYYYAYPHQQSARAHPARDQTMYAS